MRDWNCRQFVAGQGLQYFDAKELSEIPKGSLPTRASNYLFRWGEANFDPPWLENSQTDFDET